LLAHVPRLPFSLDPLIAEAKRRARLRRSVVLALLAVVVAAAIAATIFSLRSSGTPAALCVTPPAGWRERPAWGVGSARWEPVAGLVLTNFRFGRPSYDDGLVDYRVPWPRGGVIIEILSWHTAKPEFPGRVRAGRLELRRSDRTGLEGFYHPVLRGNFRFEGRSVTVTAEFRKATVAAIASANRALADVRACPA
jgi:hypothetical protein